MQRRPGTLCQGVEKRPRCARPEKQTRFLQFGFRRVRRRRFLRGVQGRPEASRALNPKPKTLNPKPSVACRGVQRRCVEGVEKRPRYARPGAKWLPHGDGRPEASRGAQRRPEASRGVQRCPEASRRDTFKVTRGPGRSRSRGEVSRGVRRRRELRRGPGQSRSRARCGARRWA